MKKFHKIQIALSVIPFLSSIFVFLVTNYVLKKKHSDILKWVFFGLIISISVSLVFFWNIVVMTGENPVLNIIASGALLAFANYLCVKLQIKCNDDATSGQQFSNKRKMIFPAIGFSALGLSVIILLFTVIVATTPSADIADMNGESTALAVITQDEVLSTLRHINSTSSSEQHEGAKTSVPHNYEDYDYDGIIYKCKVINGIKTLQMTKIESDLLTLNIDSTLESGNMEIFIIIDGVLYQKLEANQQHTVNIENAANKLVVVRIGAESAKMSISVYREYKGHKA